MSVEEEREAVEDIAYTDSDRQFGLTDALDRLILEVQAAMPCYSSGEAPSYIVMNCYTIASARGSEYIRSQGIALCLTCIARTKLKEKVTI